jgi:hypothetical protein
VEKMVKRKLSPEAIFIDAINGTVNDIFQHLPIDPNFRDDEIRNMKFQVIKRRQTQYAELMVSSDAMLFIGGMARAISDVILTELLPKPQPETKKCGQCSTIDNKIAMFCYQCGNKFENS